MAAIGPQKDFFITAGVVDALERHVGLKEFLNKLITDHFKEKKTQSYGKFGDEEYRIKKKHNGSTLLYRTSEGHFYGMGGTERLSHAI